MLASPHATWCFARRSLCTRYALRLRDVRMHRVDKARRPTVWSPGVPHVCDPKTK